MSILICGVNRKSVKEHYYKLKKNGINFKKIIYRKNKNTSLIINHLQHKHQYE